MHTHLEQWAANAAVPGEQLGVRCLAQGSHLSCGQFLLDPRFEPTTSGYKSNALSIRATTAPFTVYGQNNISLNIYIIIGSSILARIFILVHSFVLNACENTHYCNYQLHSKKLKKESVMNKKTKINDKYN